MPKIFIKDLKENLFVILLSILFPFFVPIISNLFFKNNYEDANFFIYLILFFLFLPIYLIILSSTIFKNENLNFLKVMPINFNKIVASKVLFILFNYFILTITYSSFLNFERTKFERLEIYIFFILHIYIVLFLSFLSFSFSNFFNTNLANFLTFLIFSFNFFSIAYALTKINGNLLTKYEIYLFYFLIFLFSIFLLYFSSKILYFSQKISAFKKFIFFFLFLIPSIYIFLRIPDWNKERILCNSNFYPINEREILLSTSLSEEIYLYNLENKKIKLMTELTGLNIFYQEGENLYLYGKETPCSFCNTELKCSVYYIFDKKDKNLKKIGVYPLWARFIEKIIIWREFTEKDLQYISFKNEEKNLCFKDLAIKSNFLKDGIIYKKFEEGEYKIYYSDYNKGEIKEVLKGDFDIFSNWFFPYIYKFPNTIENNYIYLYKDKKYYKLFALSGNLEDMGNLHPLADFDGDYLLAADEKKDEIILKLFKGEKLLKEFNTSWKRLWTIKMPFSKNYLKILYIDKQNEYNDAIISIEDNDIKIYNLPKNSSSYFLNKEGDLLLKEWHFLFSKKFKYPKLYFYNFKTGKKEKL